MIRRRRETSGRLASTITTVVGVATIFICIFVIAYLIVKFA